MNGRELVEMFASEIEAGRTLNAVVRTKRRRVYRDLSSREEDVQSLPLYNTVAVGMKRDTASHSTWDLESLACTGALLGLLPVGTHQTYSISIGDLHGGDPFIHMMMELTEGALGGALMRWTPPTAMDRVGPALSPWAKGHVEHALDLTAAVRGLRPDRREASSK